MPLVVDHAGTAIEPRRASARQRRAGVEPHPRFGLAEHLAEREIETALALQPGTHGVQAEGMQSLEDAPGADVASCAGSR